MPIGVYPKEKRKGLFKFGHKTTKAVRKKMSESLRGKISWNKGISPSKKTREKLSISLRGRNRGDKNPNWKGGIYLLASIIRHNFKYRLWRSDILTRDNYICVLCGKSGGELAVDHYPKMFSIIFKENNIKSLEEALNCEEFWNINNGRTLCRECHIKITK